MCPTYEYIRLPFHLNVCVVEDEATINYLLAWNIRANRLTDSSLSPQVPLWFLPNVKLILREFFPTLFSTQHNTNTHTVFNWFYRISLYQPLKSFQIELIALRCICYFWAQQKKKNQNWKESTTKLNKSNRK